MYLRFAPFRNPELAWQSRPPLSRGSHCALDPCSSPRLAFTCSLCAFFSWRGWSGQSVSQPAVTVLTIHAHTLTFYETSRMDAYIPRASALSHLHCIMILLYGLQYWYDSTFLQKNAGVSCSQLYLEHIHAAPNFLCPRPSETARKLRLDFPIKPNHLHPSLAKALSMFWTSETTG